MLSARSLNSVKVGSAYLRYLLEPNAGLGHDGEPAAAGRAVAVPGRLRRRGDRRRRVGAGVLGLHVREHQQPAELGREGLLPARRLHDVVRDAAAGTTSRPAASRSATRWTRRGATTATGDSDFNVAPAGEHRAADSGVGRRLHLEPARAVAAGDATTRWRSATLPGPSSGTSGPGGSRTTGRSAIV